MLDSFDNGLGLYETGEIDYIDLSEANLKTIMADKTSEFYSQLVPKLSSKYPYQWHWNFDKNKEDGTPDTNWNKAIANKNFRLSFYYSLDMANYLSRTNAVNPYVCESNCYTMYGLVYLKDGTDYVQLVKDGLGIDNYNGKNTVRYDKKKGEDFKKKAMEELKAQGVTFPVQMDFYIKSGDQTAADTATIMKQSFCTFLADDYVAYPYLRRNSS